MTRIDCIIIGGGIIGCGIARDLALRGLTCVLLEKGDFCSGTTSKSTRLVHGGLRYLEHLDVGLVRTSLHEREILFRTAPHLVKSIPFVLPLYDDSPHSRLKLKIGMALYDLLSVGKSVPTYSSLTKEQIQTTIPLLSDGLSGGFRYHDGQVLLPERLCMENLIDASAHKAQVHNHVQIQDIRRDSLLWSVHAHVGKQDICFEAPLLVNAAGPWLEEVCAKASVGHNGLVRRTKGIHLLTKKVTDEAVYLSSQDGRMFFVVPFGPYSLIGTTDTDYTGDPDHVYATAEDVRYLLREFKRYFPCVQFSHNDIYSTYAGLRSLAPEKGHPSAVSRKHRIVLDSGCLSVVGGKITVYRQIAEEVGDMVCRVLGKGVGSKTAATPLPGGFSLLSASERKTLSKRYALSSEQMDYLYGVYGSGVPEVCKRFSDLKRIHASMPCLRGQVTYAMGSEWGSTLLDVLSRLGLLVSRDLKNQFILELANLCASVAGWSVQRKREEIAAYEAVLKHNLICLEDMD